MYFKTIRPAAIGLVITASLLNACAKSDATVPNLKVNTSLTFGDTVTVVGSEAYTNYALQISSDGLNVLQPEGFNDTLDQTMRTKCLRVETPVGNKFNLQFGVTEIAGILASVVAKAITEEIEEQIHDRTGEYKIKAERRDFFYLSGGTKLTPPCIVLERDRKDVKPAAVGDQPPPSMEIIFETAIRTPADELAGVATAEASPYLLIRPLRMVFSHGATKSTSKVDEWSVAVAANIESYYYQHDPTGLSSRRRELFSDKLVTAKFKVGADKTIPVSYFSADNYKYPPIADDKKTIRVDLPSVRVPIDANGKPAANPKQDQIIFNLQVVEIGKSESLELTKALFEAVSDTVESELKSALGHLLGADDG